MDVESLTKQITLAGAVIAACTGVWTPVASNAR